MNENEAVSLQCQHFQYFHVWLLQSRPYNDYMDIYMGLGDYIATSADGGRRFTTTAENECRRLHCTLRDLSSFLQAVGRLADHFIAEKFMDNFTDAHALIDRYAAVLGAQIYICVVEIMEKCGI